MWERHRRAQVGSAGTDRQLLWSVFLVVFVTGGLFFGYLFYASVRDIVAYGNLPFLFGGSLSQAHASSPEEPAPDPIPLPAGRVNVLVMGIDRREGEKGPWRTDTMILFSLDPASKTASMLSIPRDLWVPLPGYNMYERINAAAVYGENYGYPGGGMQYAKRAVQYNLGVPVDYYARIDFVGFEKVIDTIGGVDIDVPEEIVDNHYPTPDYRTMRLVIEAGQQNMNGDLALKYARTRYSSRHGDIDRAHRQQQVIMAARNKVLKLNFPLQRIPELLRTLGSSVETDLSVSQMLSLAKAAQEVKTEDIHSGVIDQTMTTNWTTPQGWMVLVPLREPIRTLVTELFPVPSNPAANTPLGDARQLAQEAARIEVQNGTTTNGLASHLAGDLRTVGYNVVRFGNADRFDYPESVIIVYNDKPYALESLKAELKIPADRVSRQNVPESDVDIRVILGGNAVARVQE